MAVIEGLRSLKRSCGVVITTDSVYVKVVLLVDTGLEKRG